MGVGVSVGGTGVGVAVFVGVEVAVGVLVGVKVGVGVRVGVAVEVGVAVQAAAIAVAAVAVWVAMASGEGPQPSRRNIASDKPTMNCHTFRLFIPFLLKIVLSGVQKLLPSFIVSTHSTRWYCYRSLNRYRSVGGHLRLKKAGH
jgi:hypothetical protein